MTVVARESTPPDALRLIETQEEFERVCLAARRAREVAVDTEAASFHRHRDRIYLLQLSTSEQTVVVDPLAVTDLAAFGAVLADRDVEVVFHDADYDLRLLDLEHGFRATNVFDTRIAAQLLNEPGIGLAALLEKYLGVRLDKRFQRADWSARPLSPPMLAYAATDTHYLLALRDILRERLRERGRLAWALEEFETLERVRWALPQADDEPGFLRLKGAKALKGQALALVKALYEWRESVAERTDRAAFRILNNETLLAMAKDPPATLEALAQVRGVGPDFVARRGKDVLKVLQKALALPPEQWPALPRRQRGKPDPEFEARLDRLKVARNALAARLDLAPGVLCPNGTLEAIARALPASVEELAAIPDVRRWQVAEFGPALLAALAG